MAQTANGTTLVIMNNRKGIFRMNDYFIAVVDDDQHIRNLVEAYLVKENFRTIGLSSAEEAWML